jgi:hypothetical protein
MKLKKIVKSTLILILIFILAINEPSVSVGSTAALEYSNKYGIEYLEHLYIKKEQLLKNENLRNYMYFLEEIGYYESRNTYTIINNRKYIGRFQFGISALKCTGYKHVNWVKFKNNPEIWSPKDQHLAMRRLLKINQDNLKNSILEYDGQVFGDTLRITKSGLLAASHLGGSGTYQQYNKHGKIIKKGKGVKYFLQSGGTYNPSDGNMRLSDYLYKFSGYEFDIPEENDLLTYYIKNGDTY